MCCNLMDQNIGQAPILIPRYSCLAFDAFSVAQDPSQLSPCQRPIRYDAAVLFQHLLSFICRSSVLQVKMKWKHSLIPRFPLHNIIIFNHAVFYCVAGKGPRPSAESNNGKHDRLSGVSCLAIILSFPTPSLSLFFYS